MDPQHSDLDLRLCRGEGEKQTNGHVGRLNFGAFGSVNTLEVTITTHV